MSQIKGAEPQLGSLRRLAIVDRTQANSTEAPKLEVLSRNRHIIMSAALQAFKETLLCHGKSAICFMALRGRERRRRGTGAR